MAGRTFGDKEYDPSSLRISDEEMSALSPMLQRYWGVKKRHWNKVVVWPYPTLDGCIILDRDAEEVGQATGLALVQKIGNLNMKAITFSQLGYDNVQKYLARHDLTSIDAGAVTLDVPDPIAGSDESMDALESELASMDISQDHEDRFLYSDIYKKHAARGSSPQDYSDVWKGYAARHYDDDVLPPSSPPPEIWSEDEEEGDMTLVVDEHDMDVEVNDQKNGPDAESSSETGVMQLHTTKSSAAVRIRRRIADSSSDTEAVGRSSAAAGRPPQKRTKME